MLYRTRIMLFAWLVIAVTMPARDACAQGRKLTTQELAQWIDEHVAADYERAAVALPPVVDDATFLRRVFLDLQGRIPSVAQARDFLAD